MLPIRILILLPAVLLAACASVPDDGLLASTPTLRAP
jgi:starvation-inducible outer membrane lipoprotein